MLTFLAPTLTYACTLEMTTPETLMREGAIVVRVLVLQRDEVEKEGRYTNTATVFVQESFSGALPSRLIEVRWRVDWLSDCLGGSRIVGIPPLERTSVVALSPFSDTENVYWVGGRMWFDEENEMEALERFARLRERGDGVWVDLVAFGRLLESRPELPVLRSAFPEVEFIPFRDAPPELQHDGPSLAEFREYYEIRELDIDEEDPRSAYRSDQSRFVAYMRDGLVVGGEFR
ncbi:MAG: hypothetical protein AAFX92_03760 [Pseudomonadota bacterium]